MKYKLYIHQYSLHFKNSNKIKNGALLLFEFPSGNVGYSDLMPTPELELSLPQQLQLIKDNKPTNRFKLCLNQAQIDAQARFEKRSLFSNFSSLYSHYQVSDIQDKKKLNQLIDLGYSTLKIKIKSLNEFFLFIKKAPVKDFKWRIDFNGSLKGFEWLKVLKTIEKYEKFIDFIEDPVKPNQAESYSSKWIAEDWIKSKLSLIQIVKPGRDTLKEIIKNIARNYKKRIIFTHNMDSLIGQAWAGFMACEFYNKHPQFKDICGLHFNSFKPHELISSNLKAAQVDFPKGFGIGFGELLRKQEWKRWI